MVHHVKNLRYIAWGLLLCLLTGCTRPHEGVQRAYEEKIKTGWREQIDLQASGPQGERIVNWEQALALMMEDNIDLLRRRRGLVRSKQAVDDVLLDYIPPINLHASTPDLLKISRFSFKDLNFNVSSYLRFPDIKNIYMSLYQNKLSYLASILAYDIDVRKKTIELYKLFLEYEGMELKKHQHEWKNKLAEKTLKVDEFKGKRMMKEVEKESFELMKGDIALQNRIGRFFGSDNLRWVLIQEHMPSFDYLNHPLEIEDPDKVNQRFLQLIAVDLERARLHRRYNIKARYWPDYPNLQVNMPTLLRIQKEKDKDGNTTKTKIKIFDADSVTATANMSWNIDTRGRIKRDLEEHDFEQAIREREIKRQARELINGFIQAQEGLRILDRQRQYLEFREKAHRLSLKQAKTADPEKLVKETLALEEARYQLKKALSEVNTAFWVVDESRWPDFEFDAYVQSDPNSKGKKLRRPKVL